jgi:hypothetical protein
MVMPVVPVAVAVHPMAGTQTVVPVPAGREMPEAMAFTAMVVAVVVAPEVWEGTYCVAAAVMAAQRALGASVAPAYPVPYPVLR